MELFAENSSSVPGMIQGLLFNFFEAEVINFVAQLSYTVPYEASCAPHYHSCQEGEGGRREVANEKLDFGNRR